MGDEAVFGSFGFSSHIMKSLSDNGGFGIRNLGGLIKEREAERDRCVVEIEGGV